jgi:hypothetical protein
MYVFFLLIQSVAAFFYRVQVIHVFVVNVSMERFPLRDDVVAEDEEE